MGKSKLEVLRNYQWVWFQRDLTAGATLAFVALPQSMAYAMIAGVDPVYGLYAFMVGSIVGAIFGSSRHLQTGPTNASSIIVASSLIPFQEFENLPGLVFLLSLLSGGIQLLAGLLKLGNLTQFLSRSVLVGFIAGAGLLIAVNQLPHLLGIRGRSNESIFDGIRHVAAELENTQPETMALGVGTILLVVVLNRISPKTPLGVAIIPSYLIAIMAAAAVVMVFRLDQQSVRVVGAIPGSLPPLSIPVLQWEFVQALTPGAIAIALIGFAESTSAAKTVAAFTGDRLNMDREFLGQGVAKMVTAFLSGIPVSGSLTRTQLCFRSGAETYLANVYAGILLSGIVLFFSPLVQYIPLAGLAGIVMMIAAGMVDWSYVRLAMRSTRADAVAMVVTFITALLFPLDIAIYIGVGVSLAMFLKRVQTPRLIELDYRPGEGFREIGDRHHRSIPEVAIIHVEGDVFFGAVDFLEDQILKIALRDEVRVVILRMKRACCLDATSVAAIHKIAHDLHRAGKILYISGATEEIVRILQRSGIETIIGSRHIFRSGETIFNSTYQALKQAVDYLHQKEDKYYHL